ncbi:MAG: hypothetical protein NVSMB49_02260 [Ktedonobacteraceae bacterium]
MADFKDPFLPLVLEVRTIRNETELYKVATLSKEAYGEHTVDFKGLLDWWLQYPHGSYALVRNRVLIGEASVWPLTKNAFDMLITGNLKERDIRKDDICKKNDKQIYWYLGNIILDKKYRGKKLALFLLKSVAKSWVNEGRLADTVELCALGATAKGCYLLEKLGFHITATKSLDGLPIYRRTATITELNEDLEELWKKGEEPQSK